MLLSSPSLYFLWSLFSNYVAGSKLRFKTDEMGKGFSQTNEDLECAKYLPEKFGNYIDVGAGQPVHGSNTFFLYKRGWNGIAIDPIENNKRLFNILRRRDIFQKSLIGNEGNGVWFYEIVPYLYSTTSMDFVTNWIAKGRKVKSKNFLKLHPLSNFTPNCSPITPSFLSVDVEGMELESLMTINWETYKPRVICVEEWEDKILNGISEIRVLLHHLDYVLVARTRLSTIFVHRQYLNLNPELRPQNSIE